VAEESGLIEAVGSWVRERALTEAGTALRLGPVPMTLSINLSGLELDLPDLTGRVLSLCERAGIEPESLCFELTESSLVSARDDRGRYEQVLALEATGARLAVDDFGTGYSALSYLKHLPVDVVKIDRSFVAGLDVTEADAVLVEAITRMSHALGLRVVAEGVETESELAVLREIGVDDVQGYLFARPMTWADAVGARLAP
jgi:EAL domain-containing protein (putative c-di-GMP-specific phosphodiesterase class I)